jgi:hypothetical protein
MALHCGSINYSKNEYYFYALDCSPIIQVDLNQLDIV